MAVKVWYVLNTAAVSPAWNGNLQDGGTAPTDAACSFGYAPGKLAISSFCLSRLGASSTSATTGTTSNVSGKTGPTVGTGATNTTAGDSFSPLAPYSGTFVSGNWTFVWNMRASTAGLVGRLGMRIWASANASGASARELTSGEIFSSSVTLSTTANTNMGFTWAAPAVTLNNEYIFFQLEYQEQTSAGSSNSDNAMFRVGSSITTTNFVTLWQGASAFAGASTLAIVNPQTLVAGPITSGLNVWYPFDILATQWDPNFKQDSDAVNGLSDTDPGTAIAGTTRATSSKSSGKWQFEIVFSGATGWANLAAGICQASHVNNQWPGFDTVSWAYWATGNVYTNSASVDTVSSWALGDVVGVLVDLTAGKLWFTKNGAVIGGTNGGNPATNTGGYTIATGVAWYPGITFNSGVIDSATANFGATALTYPVSGFTAWDTSTSDASGTNDWAILTGTTLPSLTTGKIGSALSFNGSNSVAFTSLTPFNQLATSSFSISAWVKTTATDGNILCLRNSTNGNSIIWLNVGGFNNSGTGKLGFTCRDDNANFGIFNVNGTTAINDGTWHHVCGTFTYGSNILSVYVDGALQNTATFTISTTLTFDTVWSAIAADPSGSNPNLVGSLDDFRFYNRALSSTEVNQIATQTEGFYVTGVGLYLFESTSARLAGAGSLTAVGSGATRWQVTAPLAGAGLLSAITTLQLGSGTALAGTGTFTSKALQWVSSGASLNGAGSLAVNITRWIPTSILAPATSGLTALAQIQSPIFGGAFAGAGTQSSTPLSVLLGTASALSGAGAARWPTIDPTDQLMAAYGSLAGSGALVGDVARVVAAGTLWQAVLNPWAGASTLASNLNQTLLSNAVWTGSGSALGGLAQQLFAGATPFTGAGTLTGNAPVLRIASSALAGSGALNAASAQWLTTSSAVVAGAGLLAATAVQQQSIAALASGAGALGGDVFVPGHNLWSAILNVWPATGALSATATASLVASSNLAAASTQTGSLTTRMPVSSVEAGVGQLAPVVSSLRLAASASAFSSIGTLTAAYQQLLVSSSILGGLGSLAASSAQQLQAAAAGLSGLGSLAGDVSRVTGGQIQQIDAVTYLGLSALTAQTAQWLVASATQLSGAGALTPSFASLVKPVSLSPVGQGLMAASALQQMVVVSAAAGAGFLIGDVQRFTPGVQQGTAALAGAGSLLPTAQQLLATQGLFSAFSNLTAAAANTMAAGAVWAGTGVSQASLAQAFPLASLWAGQGILGADIVRLALVPGLSSQLASFGSLEATLKGLQAGLAAFPGVGAMTVRIIDLMALQALAGAQGDLLAGLSQFELVAATLAASGYGSQWLGQVWQFDQSLAGNGVLTGNVIQTSIRVVTATIIGRPSESGIIGSNPIAATTVIGQDPRAGVIGRNPTAATMIGQDPRAGVIGQGDFVTLH